MKTSVKILKEYLRLKHPDYLELGVFSENDMIYIAEYSVEGKQEAGQSEKIKALGIGKGYDQYFREGTPARKIRRELQDIRDRFSDKINEEPKAFGGEFLEFLDWWVSEMYVNGKHYCCYCGVDEDIVMAAFDNKLISSTKKSFSRELQIERLDPNGGYNRKNCKFACAVCNNAKSDMFKTPDSFIKYFKPHRGIRDFWYDTKEQIENMNKTDK